MFSLINNSWFGGRLKMLFGVFAALVFRRPFVLSDIGYLVFWVLDGWMTTLTLPDLAADLAPDFELPLMV
ncbi:hypothetical protein [Neisseria sicca]|uniref:hypothetical protein n=1 Tax=Neisseria sicca TaxID=490 RepID=UPI0011BD0A97|nr:hypothetical protein [Neisseria sicca]